MTAKTALRADARAARACLSPEERKAYSAQIVEHLLRWEAFVNARTVMAYASIGNEVDLWPLLARILADGKRLLLPRCLGGGIMAAMDVAEIDRLAPGTLGILEPPEDALVADKREIDLILAPGLLFDKRGNRLGQGGGYYDRFLSDYRGISCGVAFGAQIVPALDVKPHDRPVDALVTERGMTIAGRDTHV